MPTGLATTAIQRVVHGLDDQRHGDLGATRDAMWARRWFGGAKSDLDQRDEIVDRHGGRAAAVANAHLGRSGVGLKGTNRALRVAGAGPCVATLVEAVHG